MLSNALKFAFLSGVLVACGGDQQQVVRSFSYEITNNILGLELEFTQNIEINTELYIPILDYGTFILTPPIGNRGMILAGNVDLDYIFDARLPRIEKTRDLPNGRPMSSYITDDLARIRLEHTDKIHSNVYIGSDSERMFLGTAIELGYIDENFPPGLVISFRIQDPDKRNLGILSLFGPKLRNGELVEPGGFFFASNVNDLVRYNPTGEPSFTVPMPVYNRETFEELIEIQEPYTKKYSDPLRLQRLLNQFREAGYEAGYVD